MSEEIIPKTTKTDELKLFAEQWFFKNNLKSPAKIGMTRLITASLVGYEEKLFKAITEKISKADKTFIDTFLLSETKGINFTTLSQRYPPNERLI